MHASWFENYKVIYTNTNDCNFAANLPISDLAPNTFQDKETRTSRTSSLLPFAATNFLY